MIADAGLAGVPLQPAATFSVAFIVAAGRPLSPVTRAFADLVTTTHRPFLGTGSIASIQQPGGWLARCGQSTALIMISTHAAEDYADLIAESLAVGFLPKAELSAVAIRRILDRV